MEDLPVSLHRTDAFLGLLIGKNAILQQDPSATPQAGRAGKAPRRWVLLWSGLAAAGG